MTLQELNALDSGRAQSALERCCGSRAWVSAMMALRPFPDREALHRAAERAASGLDREDWLEAFAHHPRIGDVTGLRERFASTAGWAGSEQSGAAAATEAVLGALARANHDYERRFGYVFIVCATGKCADEMLAILESRLPNDPARELEVAAAEQRRITALRLDKLLEET